MIGNNIFAASSYEGVFLSTNNGGNWIQVNNGLTDLHVFALAVYGSNIFAGTGGGVFASSNNGATWSSMNAGLTNSSIASLAIHDNNFFAGTNGSGVFVSPVLTIANFTPVNGAANDVITITGTGFSATPSNNVVKFNGILTAALTATPTTLRVPVPNGAGSGPINVTVNGQTATSATIFSVTAPIVSVKNDSGNMDEEMIPDGIILFDPHPNPFTDRVFIQYALPKEVRDAGAQIEIYNAMGARILLMNARQQPGPGKWTWESEGQTFGMYFVRLTCGDQTVTKKFLKR